MIAQILVYIYSVFYIVAIEINGILAYRRCERILQQPYLVVIYIDIGEDILHYHVQYVTGLDELVYSTLVLAEYY